MSRGICQVCKGPAYIGLDRVECVNPECAPFDPMSVVSFERINAPSVMRARGHSPFMGELWAYDAARESFSEAEEQAWAIQRRDSCGYEFPRPTKEESFAAWAVASSGWFINNREAMNRDTIASEPARRACRALSRGQSEEVMRRAFEACGLKYAQAVFLAPEDWEPLAWAMWRFRE
jgi:hypothetical protein